VLFVAAEFEDVPLREAEVFEEHPGRVWEVRGLRTAEFGREIFNDVVEFGMSASSGEKVGEVFAQLLVLGFGHGASAVL
jgi:hypothetical protein